MSGRVAAIAGTGVVVGVVMLLLDMEPRLVLVGLVVIVVGTSGFLLLDLGDETAVVDWHAHDLEETSAVVVDLRVQHLRGSLHRSTSRRRSAAALLGDGEVTDQIVRALTEIVDDTLRADHGIDRSSDPDGAAEVLGPELARFVTDADELRGLSRRRLTTIVTLIEQLHERAPAAVEERT